MLLPVLKMTMIGLKLATPVGKLIRRIISSCNQPAGQTDLIHEVTV